MRSQESYPLAAPLACPIEKDANAAQVARAMVAMWQRIDAALTPVLGRRGVAAIYKRSLYLTALHPWLQALHENIEGVIDLDALSAALVRQSSADALAAGNALLQTFYALLTRLVGASLTERLLRPVVANSISPPPVQDTSS